MKDKEVIAHMKAAYAYSELSHCTRRQVGCVLVKDGSIISIGYNGTPAGEDNNCEDCDGRTKPEVIHAEDNALRKLIKRTESSVGCAVFVTTAPCKPCAEKLADAEVAEVFYNDIYHNTLGVQYLNAHGIKTTQFKNNK